MSYTAKTRDELSRRALGALITRSKLSDVNEGSVIDTIAKAIGAMASGIEYRLEQIRDSFDFRNATGDDLDKRLAELPPYTISRHPAQRARGRLSLLIQSGLTEELTIPTGSLFSRSDNGLTYTSLEEVTVSIGQTSVLLEVEAVTTGTAGNAPSNAIDIIEEAPSQIISIEYNEVISTGREAETDTALKRRALLYLQSLARCQPLALEYLALSTELPQRLVIANIYEDPHNLGMSTLFIEDGSGTLGDNKVQGLVPVLIAPVGGITTFYHEAPAVSEVTPALLINNTLTPLADDKFISIPERGVIYLEEDAVLEGETLTVMPYQRYTGAIAEIQSLIEGDPSDPDTNGGWRACGTRVRVQAPITHFVNLDIQIFVQGGTDIPSLEIDASEQILAFVSELKTSAPLYLANIIDIVMDITGVENCHVYKTGTLDRFNDTYPPRGSVIRLNTLNILPTES